jgi:hypothetical protein
VASPYRPPRSAELADPPVLGGRPTRVRLIGLASRAKPFVAKRLGQLLREQLSRFCARDVFAHCSTIMRRPTAMLMMHIQAVALLLSGSL